MSVNVFLSFDAEDKDMVSLFRGQAKNENNDLEFSDYSVKEPFNSTNADYIKSQIRNLIDKVSVCVCLIGYKTSKSQWVDWEIRESAKRSKGLVGVRLHKSPYLDIPPQALTDNDATIVNWDINEIMRAINHQRQRAGY